MAAYQRYVAPINSTENPLSTGAKVAIGVGVVGLLGVGAFYLLVFWAYSGTD